MDFIDQIKALAEKVSKMKEQILTEEATKNAFIMPFIQNLGYDIFNPNEVVPEYIADVGVKKGEKVDYAILKDGNPIVLVECKHWKEDLLKHNEQLFRYFTVSRAKFGILTNGINFMFFTDLVEANKMDKDPFFQFDITMIKEQEVEELKKFHKSYFEVEAITTAANDLKYSSMIKKIFNSDLKKPSEDFVKYYIYKVFQGRATANITSYFTDLVEKSLQQAVSDLITDRLKNALVQEADNRKNVESETEDIKQVVEKETVSKTITTDEELEGYQIVKAILRNKISVSRITYRDAQSYFAIFLDDNNRKPICRLYLNSSKKYISFFDGEKKENKNEIKTIDEIFIYAESLENMIGLYEKNVPS